jgi:signal transduction histidine kinase
MLSLCGADAIPESSGGNIVHRAIGSLATEERARRKRTEEIDMRLKDLPPSPISSPTTQAGCLIPLWGTQSGHELIVDLGSEYVLEGMAVMPTHIQTPLGQSISESRGLGSSFPESLQVHRQENGQASSTRHLVAQVHRLEPRGALPVWLGLEHCQARYLLLTASIDDENPNRTVAMGEVVFFAKGDCNPIRVISVTNRVSDPGGYGVSAPLEAPPMWSLQNLTDGISVLGGPLVPAQGQAYGFQSRSRQEDDVKWVEVDLGASTLIDSVVLFPTTRQVPSTTPGFGFPIRFRVETAEEPSFSDSVVLFSSEGKDFPSPGLNPVRLSQKDARGRYVRVTATKLYRRFFDHGLLLGEMQVWSGGRNVALHRPVRYRDTFADDRFQPAFLVDGLNGPYHIVDTASWLQALSERRVLLGELNEIQNASALWSQRVSVVLEKILIAGVPLLFLAVAMACVVVLRRQVVRQTALVGQQLRKEAASEERSRIARDMHDTVGARLTQLSLLQERVIRDKTLPPTAKAKLQAVARSTHEVAQVMDEIVWSINPRHDTLPALVSYLSHVQCEYLEPLGMNCKQEIPTELPVLPVSSATRHQILSMFKECLQNIAKHSGASTTGLHIKLSPTELVLRVVDNGQWRAPIEDTSSPHEGLINLQERAASLSGSFSLSTTPLGTEAHIALPIASLL